MDDVSRRSKSIINERKQNHNKHSNHSKKRKHANDINESQQIKKRKLNENSNKTMEQRFRELFAKNLSLSQELRRCKREKDENKQNMNHYKQEMEHYKHEMEHYERDKNHYKQRMNHYKQEMNDYQQQSNHHKQEMDHYKQEMNYYKDKYLNLKNTLIAAIKEDQNDDTNCNQNSFESFSDNTINENIVISTEQHRDTINIKDNNNNNSNNEIEIEDILIDYDEISTSPSPPPSHYFDKQNKKNIQLNNDLSNNSNRYFVSVDCKFCGKHYNDFNQYVDHLKTEFDDHPSKTWLKCDEYGCDSTKTWSVINFVTHLSSHGHPHAFYCNANTLNGTICQHSTSSRSNMVAHLKTKIHNITLKTSKKYKEKRMRNDEDSETDDNYICEEQENEDSDCNDDDDDDDDDEYEPISDNDDEIENDNNYLWKHCHFVSVDCKFCGKHHDDINEYIDDLQYHFDNDPSKTWLKCNEYGCDPTKTWTKQLFMAHLCYHRYQHPFHCKLKTLNGNKCQFSTSTKGNMVKHHLTSNTHKIMLKSSKKLKEKKRGKWSKNDEESESNESDDNDTTENDNNYVWKHCHFVSVECKFCEKHFDDIREYIDHLKTEFNNDPSKTWLICNEFGCDYSTKIWRDSRKFIIHLCSHGHQRPFHCNAKTLDGTICQHSASSKSNIVTHLRSKIHKITLKTSKKERKKEKKKNKASTDNKQILMEKENHNKQINEDSC